MQVRADQDAMPYQRGRGATRKKHEVATQEPRRYAEPAIGGSKASGVDVRVAVTRMLRQILNEVWRQPYIRVEKN